MKFIKITNHGKKKRKMLRTLKSTDYGMVEDGSIFVNVEKIWTQGKGSFNHFVKEFNLTCTHELLHILIADQVGNSTSIVGEEKAVRNMLNEKWNKKLEKQYLEDEKLCGG